MAKIDDTPDVRVLVGIDTFKHRHEVLIAAPGKTRRRRMTITNTLDETSHAERLLTCRILPTPVGPCGVELHLDFGGAIGDLSFCCRRTARADLQVRRPLVAR
jgi:hypothetical protein